MAIQNQEYLSIISVYKALKWNLYKGIRKLVDLKTIFWMPRQNINMDKLFADFEGKDFFFIQIGANDGITGDNLTRYIKKYNWKGILVEPVPFVFERLKINYRDFSNLIFENSAISTHTGFAKFYSIAERDLNNNNLFEHYNDFKIDQLSSFEKATLMKHTYMHPDFQNLIIETEIATLNITDLLSKHNVEKIDLLQIDTEGFDFKLLISIDFHKVSPSILIFEHQHMKQEDYKKLLNKLKKYGYKNYKYNWDTVSIKTIECIGK